jgi:hypothetical protein
MSPNQIITWGDVAQRFFVPLLLATVSIVGGWSATELSSMRQEIQMLKIQVAELKVEMRLHEGRQDGN